MTLYLSAGLICERINRYLWPLFKQTSFCPLISHQPNKILPINRLHSTSLYKLIRRGPLWVCHHKLGERWQQLRSQGQSDVQSLKMFRCDLCNFSPGILLFVSFAFSSMVTNPPCRTAGQMSKYTKLFFSMVKNKNSSRLCFLSLC